MFNLVFYRYISVNLVAYCGLPWIPNADYEFHIFIISLQTKVLTLEIHKNVCCIGHVYVKPLLLHGAKSVNTCVLFCCRGV